MPLTNGRRPKSVCLGPTLEPQVPAVGLVKRPHVSILPVLSEGRTYMYTSVDSVGGVLLPSQVVDQYTLST